MVLLWFAQELHKQGKIGPLRVAFVHHHTRQGQDYDARLVEEFCQANDIPFEVLHARGLAETSGDFENRARKIRRSLLIDHLQKNELLWLGHHIDDSYEWSLLQRYRSGRPKSSLGIPVRNGPIVRPFLCVTKDQLFKLSRQEGIVFREDPTNSDTNFDRNFLRQEVIPLIKKRHPKYLKHYVNHANHMAALLHLSITNRISGGKIHIFQQGAIIQGNQFSPYQVQDLLHSFSHKHRGETTSQILKMLKAIDNGKKGPFHFSGGTEAYFSSELLMIYQQKIKNYDETIAGVLKSISNEELESLPRFTWRDLERSWDNLTRASDAMMNMPGLVLICESVSVKKTLNASVFDSLFPQVSLVCQERGLSFTTCLKCLETWKRKKNKLPETLRLLPLWTLSNLFASQE